MFMATFGSSASRLRDLPNKCTFKVGGWTGLAQGTTGGTHPEVAIVYPRTWISHCDTCLSLPAARVSPYIRACP